MYCVTRLVETELKTDHLGRVTTSLKIDPQLRDEAKSLAAKRQLTLGNIIEEALVEYLSELQN